VSVKGSRGELVVNGSCRALIRSRVAAQARSRAEAEGMRTYFGNHARELGGPDPDMIASIVVQGGT
jgi:hypothetical protein